MRPFLPCNPHIPLPQNGGWGLAFQVVNSVCLTVVTSKILFDMLRDRKESGRAAQPTGENLGPMVRCEVERALAAYNARRGRGS